MFATSYFVRGFASVCRVHGVTAEDQSLIPLKPSNVSFSSLYNSVPQKGPTSYGENAETCRHDLIQHHAFVMQHVRG
jgi:hypothetical protein